MGFSLAEMSGLTELMKDRNIWKALLAELLGTMILVFVGCGSCTNWNGDKPSIVQISLAFGITVATMAQAVGHISGCHINPAVTVGLLVAAKIKPIKAALYILFQCAGGIIGAAILRSLLPPNLLSEEELGNNLGMTTLGKGVGVAQAFGIECVITFVLVLTVFGVCDELRDDVKGSAPLAIGLSITACHLAAIKFTGSSMNPARTFGPAVISGVWDEHWVYWMGPCVGGAIAGILYTNAFRGPKKTPRDNDNDNKRDYDYEGVPAKDEMKEVA